MNRVWAPLLLHALAIVACGEIVGIHDVPIPIDVGPRDANVVDGSAVDASETSHDATTPDAFGDEGSPADVASEPDAAMDVAVSEAAAVDASIDAAVDAATCAPTWNTVPPPACNQCGNMFCCAQLAMCQALDDSGLSRCRDFVSCITGYTGTNPPSTGDTNCKADVDPSTAEYNLAQAALSCIRAACPTDCHGL